MLRSADDTRVDSGRVKPLLTAEEAEALQRFVARVAASGGGPLGVRTLSDNATEPLIRLVWERVLRTPRDSTAGPHNDFVYLDSATGTLVYDKERQNAHARKDALLHLFLHVVHFGSRRGWSAEQLAAALTVAVDAVAGFAQAAERTAPELLRRFKTGLLPLAGSTAHRPPLFNVLEAPEFAEFFCVAFAQQSRLLAALLYSPQPLAPVRLAAQVRTPPVPAPLAGATPEAEHLAQLERQRLGELERRERAQRAAERRRAAAEYASRAVGVLGQLCEQTRDLERQFATGSVEALLAEAAGPAAPAEPPAGAAGIKAAAAPPAGLKKGAAAVTPGPGVPPAGETAPAAGGSLGLPPPVFSAVTASIAAAAPAKAADGAARAADMEQFVGRALEKCFSSVAQQLDVAARARFALVARHLQVVGDSVQSQIAGHHAVLAGTAVISMGASATGAASSTPLAKAPTGAKARR